MKKIFLSILTIVTLTIQAQTSSFIHTSGKTILGSCNDTIAIKGINYAPYNWGYAISDLKINEIAQTGANTVRLVWYWSNPGAGVYTNYVALDSAISKCIQHKMMVILELHDFTCGNNPSSLTNGAGWWTNSFVFPILQKYKQSIIVNIANEALKVNWTSNPTTALATYKSTYQNIISNLRNVTGFDFPLMIDAPDCGQNSDAFITSNTANDLITFDPKHNLIFSAHAYWFGYANNDSLLMATKINNIISQNIPFVLGEIANQQDDATMCQYNLNYKPLLNYCQQNKINWLAWSWDHDDCPARQISSTGNFANLTTYGNDIVNNPNYGLYTKPANKNGYLLSNGCAVVTNLIEKDLFDENAVFPNPTQGVFSININSTNSSLKIYNSIGNEIDYHKLSSTQYQLSNSSAGLYILKIQLSNGTEIIKKLIVQ